MNLAALNEIAERMVTPGGSVLAADESAGAG
jgi:fructose-bisphosphate aldolase class 1